MVEVSLEAVAVWVVTVAGIIISVLWYMHDVKMSQKRKHKRIYERIEELEVNFENFRMLFYEFKPGKET